MGKFTRAIYPGTFDPITMGHLDIIQRAYNMFDEIIVAVADSKAKKPMFSLDQRVAMVKAATEDMPNIKVIGFHKLVVDLADELDANILIRGLRAVSDFEYELQMALMNRRLNRDVTTVFLMPNEKYTYLNSTIVKEVARYGGNIENFVTPMVAEKLLEKLKKG